MLRSRSSPYRALRNGCSQLTYAPSLPLGMALRTQSTSLSHQSRLCLLPLIGLYLCNLLPGTIKPSIGLIKRILRTLLKLLPDHIDPLLPSQPLLLLLQLRQSPRLIRRIRRLEPALWMPVQLLGWIVCSQR